LSSKVCRAARLRPREPIFAQVVSQNSALLAPLCVDAVLHIGDLTSSSADLRNIKVRRILSA
jgi:hypothetical protein